ncbi:MAG: rhomboid family intramembrane serine protease [Bacteroidetes bacterium]|nr:rhomboid family intramembrane serine protease [Bacteroidota bacterium]
MGLDSRDYYKPSGYGGFSFFPPVLKNLIIANVVVFFIQMIFRTISFTGYVTYEDLLTKYFALIPFSNGLVPILNNMTIPANFYPWQLITYQFLHGSFSHILLNMFMLWMFGMEIENVMGSRKFLTYYLICGIAGGLVQLFLAPIFSEGLGPTIGASGAVFGVMIAFAMFFPDRYIFLYFLIPIKAKYLITIMVIFEFMSVGNQSLIAHLVHVGGALAGILFILVDRRNNFSRSRIFGLFRKPKSTFSSGGFGRAFRNTMKKEDVEDAKFYDLNDNSKKDDSVSQEEIDRILDKISQSGYQNLTDREKKILFEASRKK